MAKIRTNQEGYAFLLAMGAMVTVGAAAMVGPQSFRKAAEERDSRQSTLSRLEVVQSALVDYVGRNKRLPCPSDGTKSLESSGKAIGSNTDGSCNFAGLAVKDGTIPWETLGLPADAALDKWNRRITYRIFDGTSFGGVTGKKGLDFSSCFRPASFPPAKSGGKTSLPKGLAKQDGKAEKLAKAAKGNTDAIDGQENDSELVETVVDAATGLVTKKEKAEKSKGKKSIKVPLQPTSDDPCARTGKDILAAVKGIGLAVSDGNNNAILLPDGASGAAFVLISHGENGSGARTASGKPYVAAASTSEAANAGNGIVINAADYSGSKGGGAFDDIVLAMSALELAEAAGLGPRITDSCGQYGYTDLNTCGGDTFIFAGSGKDEASIRTALGGANAEQLKQGTTTNPTVLNFGKVDANNDDVPDPGGGDPALGESIRMSKNKSACAWETKPKTFTAGTLRAFWEFRLYGSVNSADGFVFGLIPNATFANNPLPCGNSFAIGGFADGSDLAWVGSMDPARPSTFKGPKMGLEFDVWFSDYNYRNDPLTTPSNPSNKTNARNHIAVLRENSTIHGWRAPCGSYVTALGSAGNNLDAAMAALNKCTNDFSFNSGNLAAAGALFGLASNFSNGLQFLQALDGNGPVAKAFHTNPTCDTISTTPGDIGCTYTNKRDWLEDRTYSTTDRGTPYNVRVEVQRKCDNTCGICGTASGTKVLFKAYIDSRDSRLADLNNELPATFDDPTAKDLTDPTKPLVSNRIHYCMKDPGTDVGAGQDIVAGITPAAAANLFDSVKVGFTMGTGGQNNGMQITNYRSGMYYPGAASN